MLAFKLVFIICHFVIANCSCVKVARTTSSTANQAASRPPSTSNSLRLVNINTAEQPELEKLPGLGPALANRIIAHRNRYGRFRRIEHLISVRGISRRRFEELRSFVIAE